MTYVEGFVVAVPRANRDAYHYQAAEAASVFRDCGAMRVVEAWGDDVPDGKVTDFRRAVQATPEEDVVFSWVEYPSRESRDVAQERIMADARIQAMAKSMPFDGKRMIYGGFSVLSEAGQGIAAGYVDGSVVPVPEGNRDAYLALMNSLSGVFLEHGAVRLVEAWGDDVPDGKLTDFKGAVQAVPEEKVVFAWIEWPDKATRDAAWPKIMADPRMQPPGGDQPFDGRRMIFGGFAPLLDTASA